MPNLKTSSLVLNPRIYTGSVTPPALLEDQGRFRNNGTYTNITQTRLPSGLWALTLNGTTSKVTFAVSTCKVQTFTGWINSTTASRSIVDFDSGTHSIELDATPNVTATGWASPTIYVNGVLSATGALNVWKMITVTTATPFTMSALVLGQEVSWYGGVLALPKLYNRVLSATEIYKTFQAERRFFNA